MGHQVAAHFRFSLTSPATMQPSSVHYAVKKVHIKDLHHMPLYHQTGKLACACSVCSVKEFHVEYKVHQSLTKQAKVVYSESSVKRIQAIQSACAVKKIHGKDYAIAHLPASEEV